MTPPIKYRYWAGEVNMYIPQTDDRDRFHARKHPRLKSYDYSRPNCYFITICTWERTHLFGDPAKLNWIGALAEEGIRQIGHHFSHVQIDKFVVMPNHLHMILALEENTTDISTVIGQYQSYVSHQIHQVLPEKKIWQTFFHDHIIRDQASYEKIWLYIHSNPDNWEKDCFYSEK